MKRFIRNIKSKFTRWGNKLLAAAMLKAALFLLQTKAILAGTAAEGYVDTAVKILIAVVIGALLLAGLYMLFGDTVLPALVDRINDMFNYAG